MQAFAAAWPRRVLHVLAAVVPLLLIALTGAATVRPF
jgi:hypothetical protein